MWITRRQKDAGFPEPIFLGGLRFWKLSDLERWERDQKAAPKTRPARDMRAVRS
jgi:predicted DNA-binding transcriptional regulator AlpA